MKILRLKKNREFKRVFEKGGYCADGRLTLYILKNGLNDNYYGVSAGKKIGNSVERNRVKRLIREAIRRNAHLTAPGFDIVVLARPGIKGEPLGSIERSFARLLKRGRAYAEDNT